MQPFQFISNHNTIGLVFLIYYVVALNLVWRDYKSKTFSLKLLFHFVLDFIVGHYEDLSFALPESIEEIFCV